MYLKVPLPKQCIKHDISRVVCKGYTKMFMQGFMYMILTFGADTSSVKNTILQSVILCVMYYTNWAKVYI